ncbi:transposase [Streptomyces sp. L06]|nr:transposase [Streptomyces sp. L06]
MKTSGNDAETSQDIDTGKKTKGRKHHLITDTPGLALTVLVTAASAHDSADGKQALTEPAAAHVTKIGADSGYQTSIIQHSTSLGNDLEAAQPPKEKDFQPPPKR